MLKSTLAVRELAVAQEADDSSTPPMPWQCSPGLTPPARAAGASARVGWDLPEPGECFGPEGTVAAVEEGPPSEKTKTLTRHSEVNLFRQALTLLPLKGAKRGEARRSGGERRKQ